MIQLCPVEESRYFKCTTLIFKKLTTYSYVFHWDDTIRRVLQPSYTGSHKVIDCDEKTKSYFSTTNPYKSIRTVLNQPSSSLLIFPRIAARNQLPTYQLISFQPIPNQQYYNRFQPRNLHPVFTRLGLGDLYFLT